MALLLWDASALAKRYLLEQGTETVNALFESSESLDMTSTLFGYAETAAILRRRLNLGKLTLREFSVGRAWLEHEILDSQDWELLSLTDDDVTTGIILTERDNLNTSDAAILAAFLSRVRSTVTPAAILVASDLRLLRAAAA